MDVNPEFWFKKKVFLTGHTGFKGAWLSYWLQIMGAQVYGYSHAPNTNPSMYNILNIERLIYLSKIADIRDFYTLKNSILEFSPDVVIHMAAQPLVRYSYCSPIETFEVNSMGTAYLLESLRAVQTVRSTIIVTTDKCYENLEKISGYREDDAMGGHDPYSSSKGCAELITSAYRRSFFSDNMNVNAVATARAGNVIGGGDWSTDRLIPDVFRAIESGDAVLIRNCDATRPWQHVLEPLSGYLILAQALYEFGDEFATGWNFGPNDSDAYPVGLLMDMILKKWGSGSWIKELSKQPHEAQSLRLDCSKARKYLNWAPRWNIETAVEESVNWYRAYIQNEDMREITLEQIIRYRSANINNKELRIKNKEKGK